MSSRFVRASKFRHVYGEPARSENTFSDLDLSTTTGEHNYISASTKFFAVAARGGGGPVLVLPFQAVGKVPRDAPILAGHTGAVYDTAWSPFNDNLLATGSDDGTIKFWNIPDGGLTERLTDFVQNLEGQNKSVTLLRFHPCANNILASGSKAHDVAVWDVETGDIRLHISRLGESFVQDIVWNYDGSLLTTSNKDKMCRVWDVRTSADAPISEFQPHEGGKSFKLTYLGASNRLLSVGFTRQSKREFKIWDPRNTATFLMTHELDQAAGVIMPFYDPDTSLLFLAGKGDGNVRYFEVVDDDPFTHSVSEYRTSVPAKGFTFLPKRACDTTTHELLRALKLTKDSVEPISFVCPRKSAAFQDDIYPDTFAGRPALSAAEWLGGADAMPPLMSMDPAKNGGVTGASATFNPTVRAVTSPSGGASGGAGNTVGPASSGLAAKSHAELVRELANALQKISLLEEEVARLKGGAAE